MWKYSACKKDFLHNGLNCISQRHCTFSYNQLDILYSCFENHCYFSSLFCCLGLSKCDKAARLYCVYFIHSSAYMQIYCCETQTSCQTTTAATAEKLIRKFCRVKLFAKCKREISKQEMSSYLWRLSSSFLPYMSSLRDNESRRGGFGAEQ